jgi:hypothetical protein
MSVLRKAALRELASSAYELDAGVLNGELHQTEDGGWSVGDTPLEVWLERFSGQEIYVIVASLEDNRPLPKKTCGTCATEYVGVECPRCRTARRRLRGR